MWESQNMWKCANDMLMMQTDELCWMMSQNELHKMMSQMSHLKTIIQINCTIEWHETGHEWDDVMDKNQNIMAPGNSWKYN